MITSIIPTSLTHTLSLSPLLSDEPGLEGASSTATLTVERDRGTFTEVTLYWEVTTPTAGSDISPTSGNITFIEGQTTATLSISALEDEVIQIPYNQTNKLIWN